MTIDAFYIKKNDLQPYYYAQIKDADGDVVAITGATICCTMKNARTGALKINRQTTGITISDATNGKFQYAWQTGDTNSVGKYYIEFEINPESGGKFTLPAKPADKAEVHVTESLDTT